MGAWCEADPACISSRSRFHRLPLRRAKVFAALDGVPTRGRGAADAAVIRARILEAVGDSSRAREQVRKALRYDGNHPDALLRDAIFSYQDEGDLYNAREALLRCVKLNVHEELYRVAREVVARREAAGIPGTCDWEDACRAEMMQTPTTKDD